MAGLDAYREFAAEYDAWFDRNRREYMLELEAVRALLPEGTGIEIGAGTGRFAQPLDVSLGVEPSSAMRQIALGRGAHVIAGTAEALPVEEGVYDYALFVTTLCFLERPEVAVKEAHRVLKGDGALIIGFIDRESTLGRQYEREKNESRFYKNATFYSVEEIKGILDVSGFNQIVCVQAVLPGDGEQTRPGVRRGYGAGSFVVLRAQRGAP